MNIQIKSGALQQVLALASLVVLILFFTFSSSNFFHSPISWAFFSRPR